MAAKGNVQNLVRELHRQGFHIDPRARHAYRLASVHSGKPDAYRVDIAQRSARLEVKVSDTWRGASDTHYFGSLTPDFAAQWVEWARGAIEGKRLPEPSTPVSEKLEADRKKRETKRAVELVRTSGPGFYVTNGGMRSRIADHPAPFRTLEDAIDQAKDRFAYLVGLRVTYLLPVEVIEAKDRDAAEMGQGYVWWTDGRRRGAPVPKEQLRFEGIRTVRSRPRR